MNLIAYLGTTGLADVSYQFLDATGAVIGSPITAGVYELFGGRGVYGVNSPTIPPTATDVYWKSTGTAAVYGYEAFDFRTPNVDTGTAGALLTSGTGTAQVNLSGGNVSANLVQIDSDNVVSNGPTTFPAGTLSTGAVMDATDIRAAVGLTTANLDTQFSEIPADVLSEVVPGSYDPTSLGHVVGTYLNSSVDGVASDVSSLVTTVGAAGAGLTAVEGIVLDGVVENSKTFRQVLRGMVAALLGKASGLATTTAVFRDNADSKARITATVDADGNRSAVTLDLT